MKQFLKTLGPGLLFAGAAIGVSHLVQSTRAGADFGFGLLWALLLANICKYPFFQYGPRYALATGESLLDGYKKLHKSVLWIYFILTLATMFTIQTAVTIVTAGLASNIFNVELSLVSWSIIITVICFAILLFGRYKLLDGLMKIIIITLTICTFIAVSIASVNTTTTLNFSQVLPENALEVGFLIAFMGWMPAPLDISIWHSLWAIEKTKSESKFTSKKALLDFNVGYTATIVLAVCFVALGALVMYNSGETFSEQGGKFAQQLITLYTQNLGDNVYIFIAVAAFTTMFSTTLTTLDASPRAMAKASELLNTKGVFKKYILWILILVIGTLFILSTLLAEMGTLVKIATILSFITAPFYAIANFWLITSKHTPKVWHPSTKLKILSWIGIIFLIGFSIWYLVVI